MERHDIGTYSTASGDQLEIYMLQIPTYHSDNGHVIPASMVYCMEAREAANRLFWPDWLQFAHMINAIAKERVFDPMEDPAEGLGLVIMTGCECPECGCRVMDELVWVDDEAVFCHACKSEYVPGEH